MSDEIRASLNIRHAKGTAPGDRKQNFVVAMDIDQSSNKGAIATQTIGTSAEDVDFGDVPTGALCVIRNLDSTNFVEIGKTVSAAFEKLIQIPAGEYAGPFRNASGVTLRAKADTAAVEIEVALWAP